LAFMLASNATRESPGTISLRSSSSLLKNLEMESFRILAGSCWGGAVELDVISSLVLGAP
jgi:hypothetical protein